MREPLDSQLAYIPQVIGQQAAAPFLIVGGMGGSAIPALVLRYLGVTPYVIMHRDYGLPEHVPAGSACIAVSYSGNTEETLAFANEALSKGLPLSVIASGGALLTLAQERGLPYVQVPAVAEPRDAILATTKALLTLTGEYALLADSAFDAGAAEQAGETLAPLLAGAHPIFYSSVRNEALSYIAKIQCNETAKIPAFSNLFPELNHNELQGFGVATGNESLLTPIVTVFIRDTSDSERIRRRMDLTEELLSEKGVRVVSVDLPEGSRAQSFLYGWWLLRTAARALAAKSGVAPDETPLIAAFKAKL